MFARIELGAGAPAELVRLLRLLGLEPILFESVPNAPRTALEPAMPPALRVAFDRYRGTVPASRNVLNVSIIERRPAKQPVAVTDTATADFVCDSSIAVACFILARALRLVSPVLTSNARLFDVIRAAVALAHGRTGVLVEGEIGVGKESLIKLIHAVSGDSMLLIYAECAGLEAVAVAAEIAPLLAHGAGSVHDAAQLSGRIHRDPHNINDVNDANSADDPDDPDDPDDVHPAARRARRFDDLGRLDSRSGGTIFFNHLGELSLAAQRNLLDLLLASAPGMRLLAASAQPLAAMVTKGEFLAQLHQLFEATLTIAPLRDRPGDLPMLARHALRMLNPALILDAAATRTLARYPFPGNLRELTNFVTRLAIVPAKPLSRHLPGTTGEYASIGRAEVLRQLEHPSLKLLWRSRTRVVSALPPLRRLSGISPLGWGESETPAGPTAERKISTFRASRPTPSVIAATSTNSEALCLTQAESLRLTIAADPRHRPRRAVPKPPA